MDYRLVDTDPDPVLVRHLTFVLFDADGACLAIPDLDGMLRLPAGEVEPGEHYLLDSTLRIALMSAGFRSQRVTPFAVNGEGAELRVYAWLDGSSHYRGERPHTDVDLVRLAAEDLAAHFIAAGDVHRARVVTDAARSYRTQDDEAYYSHARRILEPAYLRGATPQEGSGLAGTPETWREHREMIVDGIHKDGTFLDLGCANGLLMESVHEWAAERGFDIEPYGVDIGPRLVELARQRLPHWADRIEVGNAIDYLPASGRRFTFVHALADCVPPWRRADLVQHVTANLLEPGGRLLASAYGGPPARDYLEDARLPIVGESGRTCWTDKL